MIISASRRTDIPAYYARWFIQRVRAGWCAVANPFNRQQSAVVSLRPEDVDVIAFWTRSPRPLLPYLDELDRRGLRYYFQVTLLANPPLLDPHSPRPAAVTPTLRQLAQRIGPDRLVWRYDPIILSDVSGVDFHLNAYAQLAGALRGLTRHSVISLLDDYTKTARRMRAAEAAGARLWRGEELSAAVERLLPRLAEIAQHNGMEIVSCAEPESLARFGIRPGRCIDPELIQRAFGLSLNLPKDPAQRPACGCAASKDIGAYDTCLTGCPYCYATQSFERARRSYLAHDPQAAALG